MKSQHEYHRRRAAACRSRRDASVSVELLEGRALLAQSFSFPGLGPVENLPLTMLNPQPLVLNLTPTLTNATVTGTNTSVTGTIGQIGTIARQTGTSSLVVTRLLPSTAAREFSLRPDRTPSLVTPASTTPTILRLISAPTTPTTVVVSTNPPPTPLAAPAPTGPLAAHGHHGPRHHQHAGPGSLQGHHGH